MKVIVPMAGKGKRMRPYTLTTAKQLIPVGGKTIIQNFMKDIIRMCKDKVEEIAPDLSALIISFSL